MSPVSLSRAGSSLLPAAHAAGKPCFRQAEARPRLPIELQDWESASAAIRLDPCRQNSGSHYHRKKPRTISTNTVYSAPVTGGRSNVYLGSRGS